jgi:hypothetical protein
VVTITAPTTIPIISALRADLVPHREMAIRRWYYANPLWYYHRLGTATELNTNSKFYQLIDPDLRDLCRMLHEAHIHTTPSCQGHFYGHDHYEGVWELMNREAHAIRTTGLPITECESGRRYLFYYPAFHISWPDFASFYGEAGRYQTQGYLGVLLSRDRHDLICKLHNKPFRSSRASIKFDGELSCMLGGSLFAATVQPRDPDERDRQWRAITDYFRDLLQDQRPCKSNERTGGRFSSSDGASPRGRIAGRE